MDSKTWIDVALAVTMAAQTCVLAWIARQVTRENGYMEKHVQEVVEGVVAEAIARQDDRIEKRIRRNPGTMEGQPEPAQKRQWQSGDSVPEELIRGL